jgi:hypothetical protein
MKFEVGLHQHCSPEAIGHNSFSHPFLLPKQHPDHPFLSFFSSRHINFLFPVAHKLVTTLNHTCAFTVQDLSPPATTIGNGSFGIF